MKVAINVLSGIWQRLSNSSLFWYVIFGGVAYYGFTRLTKPKDEAFLDKEIPNGGKDIPTTWKPDSYVQRLHDFYDSVFPDSDYQAITLGQLASLTDGQFFYVVQTYNATWAKKDGAGWFSSSNLTLWKRANSWKRILLGQGVDLQNKFIDRMIRLKLNY
jgi:hypothetical protein